MPVRLPRKERDRVYPKYGGRIGDMKLRGFKRTYIGRVRLIQQHGEFAEHGARLRHPGDLNAFLYDRLYLRVPSVSVALRFGGRWLGRVLIKSQFGDSSGSPQIGAIPDNTRQDRSNKAGTSS